MRLIDAVEVLEATDEVEVSAPRLAAGDARRLEVPLQQVVVRFLKRRRRREEMRIARGGKAEGGRSGKRAPYDPAGKVLLLWLHFN